jgi:hypothetical protein
VGDPSAPADGAHAWVAHAVFFELRAR